MPVLVAHLVGLAIILLVLIAMVLILAVVFRAVWNNIMPELFGLTLLTWKQSQRFLWVVVTLVILSYAVVLCIDEIMKLPLK